MQLTKAHVGMRVRRTAKYPVDGIVARVYRDEDDRLKVTFSETFDGHNTGGWTADERYGPWEIVEGYGPPKKWFGLVDARAIELNAQKD